MQQKISRALIIFMIGFCAMVLFFCHWPTELHRMKQATGIHILNHDDGILLERKVKP